MADLTSFMQIDNHTGLVLEGGGMRGVFTAGVLDAFMKHEIYFRHVVAGYFRRGIAPFVQRSFVYFVNFVAKSVDFLEQLPFFVGVIFTHRKNVLQLVFRFS